MGLVVGVDVGGARIAAGLVDPEGRVLIRQTVPTPPRPADLVPCVQALVNAFRGGYTLTAVGLGVAGFVDRDRSTVLFSSLAGWADLPIGAELERSLAIPVAVENSGSAAAWAEIRFGAGVGETSLVSCVIGTGLGGGFVVDGRPYRGRFGVAAEYGHIPVVPGGLLCGCGNRGCWQMYASGAALAREARQLAKSGAGSVEPLLAKSGGDADEIGYRVVVAAAREGDPTAVEMVEKLGRWLGTGIATVASVLDPGRVVIGGGLVAALAGVAAPPDSESLELLLEPARDEFRRSLPGRGYRQEASIEPARLGSDAGLIGAADLARTRR
ncbi:ROK family protein [Cryptosporangium arvum]|uniref:Transcriptional regulator/sugar kinase n=1 Tax=Cryptosporangium arvum DSM 44712 TaxID=927661 RepID=A0A010ZPX9_9ACTN|nr:ROK family protein [Cryptosporangium arvum]EXG80729.1 transcriptional regulator/sugar kinase [Cryptosporangium arvum DSM 44712]